MNPPNIRLCPLLCFALLLLPAGETLRAAQRTGIYDSRLVAFAAFWSDASQTRIKTQKEEARAAKARGDTAQYNTIVKEITASQSALHLQVFSTAPIDDVLAGLQDRLPAIQRELGVEQLVSRWDEAALASVPPTDRVDVTGRLVDEFHLPAAKRQQVDQLKTATPLPLWRARAMNFLHLL